MAHSYWLVKSEPDVFSFDDLKASSNRSTHWDGVRNYQARNFLRDQMKIGDLVLFYHSNCEVPGVVGIAEVVKEGYPDFTAWDPKSKYYDPDSKPANPRWYMIDLKWKQAFKRLVSLEEIKNTPELTTMKVVQRGQRLSVQPVEKQHFNKIVEMGMR
jgi:predicted RNA-binding protein with PUA-like domain